MKISVQGYSDFKSTVTDLGVPTAILYSRNGSDATSVTAIYLSEDTAVVMGNGSNPITTEAILLADYPAATFLSFGMATVTP